MTDARGFSLVEALVSTSILGIVLAGGVKMLASDIRFHAREETLASVDQNLRAASETLADTLRAAGDGAPKSDLTAWIPWVADFSTNPKVVSGDTDTIFVARCTTEPVARLYARVDSGATRLEVVPTEGRTVDEVLDADEKRLVLIDDREFAHVKSASDGLIQIDTDPAASGDQGLARAYPQGTPLCRVDVTELGVRDDDTGGASLYRDDHQGEERWTVAEEIDGLEIDTADGGRTYEIRLTARSRDIDALSGGHIVRELGLEVSVRNARLPAV